MSIPLIDALRMADPEPGVYRERLNGKTVVVQVIAGTDDAPTPELAEQVMLLPWFESPFRAVGTVKAQPGPISLPDPPIIPDDEPTE
jgi:hypothetical protein